MGLRSHFLFYSIITNMAIRGHNIAIFDLDDTLVVTNARIEVTDSWSGEKFYLSPKEFNEYERKATHAIDFSQFDDPDILRAGTIVEWTLDIMKEVYAKEGAVGIITARGDSKLVREFMLSHGVDIHPELIFAVNEPDSEFIGTNAEKKQQAFKKLIEKGYSRFIFFDDDINNLKHAKLLESQYPIKIKTEHIKPEQLPEISMKRIGIFTGKFKPPHKGHYDIINQALEENDQVRIYVSDKPEGGIDAEVAIKILKKYLGKNPKVVIEKTSISPVRSAYQFIYALGETKEAPNHAITLYAAPDDMVRFDKVHQYAGKIKNIKKVNTGRAKFSDGERDLYGKDMRGFLKKGDFESFKQGIPTSINPKTIWKMLKTNETGEYTVPASAFKLNKKVSRQDINPVTTHRLVQHPTYRDGFMNESKVLRFKDFNKK
jgi:cytidyltransferase-like protein